MMALMGVVVDHSLGKSLGIWCAERKRRYQAYDIDTRVFPPETRVSFQLSENDRVRRLEDNADGSHQGKPVLDMRDKPSPTPAFQIAK
jgi:hypothetical protein